MSTLKKALRDRSRSSRVVVQAMVAGLLFVGSAPLGAQPAPGPEADPAADGAAALPPFAELRASDTVIKNLKRLGNGTIPRMLRGTDPIDKRFDAYYTQYLFPRMTQLENLDKLPSIRDDLSEFFDKAKTHQEITDRLNRLTLDWLFAIVRGTKVAKTKTGALVPILVVKGVNGDRTTYYTMGLKEVDANRVEPRESRNGDFHPTVKYNAMYMIGELNDKVSRRNKPAVPHTKALDLLLRVARARKAKESIRVAAMLGVQRHAEVDYEVVGIKKLMADSMLAILKEKPVEGRSRSGQQWIQRQALRALGSLGIAGAEGRIADTIAAVLVDDAQPVKLRAAAADALGHVEMKTAPKPGVTALTQALGTLVVDACRHEMARDNKRISRSRMLEVLRAVTVALEGPAGSDGKRGLNAIAAAGAEKDRIANLTTEITSLSEALEDDTKSADQLRRDLTSASTSIPS